MGSYCSKSTYCETEDFEHRNMVEPPARYHCGPLGVFSPVLGNLFFNIILGIVILFGPVWYAASHLHEKNLAAVFTSLAVAGVLLARRFWPNPSNLIVLIFNLVLPILLSLTILPFFYAVGPTVIANNRATFDEYLVAIDTALWGWLYPRGQVSLLLDQSEHGNPSSVLGRFYTDVLQIFYVTYYVWGYLPILILGYRYIRAWKRRDGHGVNKALAQVKLYLTGWLSSFLFVFTINTCLPAMSPRLFLKQYYSHRLEGFGLARLLIGVATEDKSFGSFPSGHFAESLVAGIYLLQIQRPTGIVVVISSVMIGLATQFLRYHYFADLIGAGLLVPLSLLIGHCITPGVFRRETARIIAAYDAESVQDYYTQGVELSLRSSVDDETASNSIKLESGRASIDVETLEDHTLDLGVDLEAASATESLPPNVRVNTFL